LPEQATRRDAAASAIRLVAWIAIAAAVIGVFSTWTSDGPLTLNGTEGPNNGWLIVILSAFALGWTRSMARGSWVGVVGVLGASIVMGWTALANWLDSRDVLGASASYGLLVVIAASIVLGSAAIARGAELARSRRTSEA
jgi:hypothetical protein